MTHDNESGLLGMAARPELRRQRLDVRVLLAERGRSPSVDRLSRFTVDQATNTFVAGSEKVVLDVPVQRQECCHHGGSMVFDKSNGNLYLATGDNTNPFASDGYAPVDYRAGRDYWDSSRTSGNTNSLSGKVLRIHPEADGTYTVPDGNLFPPGTAKTRPEIFGMGFRNPFRINIDPVTTTCWSPTTAPTPAAPTPTADRRTPSSGTSSTRPATTAGRSAPATTPPTTGTTSPPRPAAPSTSARPERSTTRRTTPV